MEALTQKYRDQGFDFVFIYAREAHPGERWPAHRTFEQKLNQARAYQQAINAQRDILVDSLDGHAHRLYGARPDMTWILDRNGVVLFKSFWSRPDLTEEVIQDILEAKADQRQGTYGQPFYSERIAWRRPDSSHDDVMAENGPQAIQDYERFAEERRKREIDLRRQGPRGF